jgi:TonB-linked SusC/RagA family outer membrane protein
MQLKWVQYLLCQMKKAYSFPKRNQTSRYMKNLLTVLLFVFLGMSVMDAQNKIVGKVIDGKSNQPLPGVSILLKNTELGTITDLDGNYNIDAPAAGTLVFSVLGFEDQEIAIDGRNTIDVSLSESTELLNEVVVVGFGTMKKENVTGATAYVNMDKILSDRPIVNAAQALQGALPGLQIVSTSGQPGATGTSINIRGFTSINGGSPLVLINNVPGSLEDLNPRDIESISVLKDAAASSIYGARAAFGVVLVTTKKAERNSPVKFNYTTTTSMSQAREIPEKATTREFVQSLKSFGDNAYFAGQNVNKWIGFLDQYDADKSQLNLITDPKSGTTYPIHFDKATNSYYPLESTNLIEDFIDNPGYSTIHNFGISGGASKLAYRINGGYSYEDGVMVTNKDNYSKYNVSAVLDADLSKRFVSNTNIMYRSSLRTIPNARYDEALQLRMYDPTGWFKDASGVELPFASPGNIVRYNTPNTNNDDNLRLFQKLEFKAAKNLSFIGEYTVEKNSVFGENINNGQRFVSTFQFVPTTTEIVSANAASIRKSQSHRNYRGMNLYSKYGLGFGKAKFDLLLGYNQEYENQKTFSASRNALIDPNTPSFNLAQGEDFSITDTYYDWAVLGYFSRLNVNYDNKYFLEGNLRYDGSSRFAKASRFSLLPSFSAGWNISKESFLRDVKALSLLKLRASWGTIGNQNIGEYYPSIPGYENYTAQWINPSSNQRFITFSPAQLISSTFTWEKVVSQNVGVDVEILDNRLSGTFDLFSRATIGMLKEALPLPSVLGTSAPLKNDADLKTTGWEIGLGWQDKKDAFRYGINVNLFDNSSKITKFDNPAQLIGQFYVGRDLGEVWGYVTDGYYKPEDFEPGTLNADLAGQNRKLKPGIPIIQGAPIPYPGDIKYKDLNGDGIINTGNSTLIVGLDEKGNPLPNTGPGDRQIIGNTTRRYQFGVNGNIGYKGLDLSFNMAGVGKRERWRGTGNDLDMIFPYPTLFDHIYKHQLDFWTPDNQDAYYPRIYGDNTNGNTDSNYSRSRNIQTKYMSDESYLRIQNITLGYTVPTSLLKKINVGSLRLFVAGNNLHTFDNLPKGLEPDQSPDSGVANRYPLMSQYSAGINLNF